jgi:hypothetical protein
LGARLIVAVWSQRSGRVDGTGRGILYRRVIVDT